MDADAKLRVKQALAARAQVDLESAQSGVGAEHSAASVDQDSSFSVDDLSQSDAAGDLAGLFERASSQGQAALKAIEALDVAPTDRIGPGAIVGFGGNRYVVGVVAGAFDCDGETYEGISTDAPLYARIDGLRAGDDFTFGDRVQRIDFVA